MRSARSGQSGEFVFVKQKKRELVVPLRMPEGAADYVYRLIMLGVW